MVFQTLLSHGKKHEQNGSPLRLATWLGSKAELRVRWLLQAAFWGGSRSKKRSEQLSPPEACPPEAADEALRKLEKMVKPKMLKLKPKLAVDVP